MDALPTAVALGVTVVLLVVPGGWFLTRQRALARRRGSFDCLLRRVGLDESWRPGTAQYAAGCLMWWNAISLSLRPARTWHRADLVVVRRAVLDVDEHGEALLAVDCLHRGEAFQLVMSVEALAGLVSWLESRPVVARR